MSNRPPKVWGSVIFIGTHDFSFCVEWPYKFRTRVAQVMHEYSFCTVAVPATPTGATPQAPFCNGPLFFIHQAARSLVIPDGRHGRGRPWLHPCLWVGKVKLGSASPLPLKQPGHDPTNTATKPLVASPRALPSQPERLIVPVKLLEGSTSLGVMPKPSGEP